jgi:CHAT domain-containing protein
VFAGDETERQSADDYMVSSYIPTIAALTRARKDWQAINRTQAVGLLVSEPAPGRGYSPIINVYNEAETVRNCFAVAGAAMGLGVQSPTTVTSVLSILQSVDVNILHMACHGVQHENPLQSAFVLGDGDLSIEELMRLDLRHATLAFLSACQTAQGDAHQPDQAVHLAASMLFCGFRSVIGTLW